MQPRSRGSSAPLFRILVVLATALLSRNGRAQPAGIALSQSFAAVTDEGGGVPPDPQGAAGPAHLVTMTNTRFTVQRKDGTVAASWTPAQFWAPVSQGDLLFDPRVMYDSLSGRWIAVIATEGIRAAPALLLAVSNGADPTQEWNLQSIAVDAAGRFAAEFPLLGANGRWIGVTSNLISLSTGGGGGAAVWAIEKAPLLAHGALSVSRFTISGADSPVAPVVTFDADEPDLFLVEQASRNDAGRGELELSRLTESAGRVALRTVGTVAAPVAWIAHPNPFDSLPQAGAAHPVTASQDDVASACLRNGMIWAVQTATIPAAGNVPLHSGVQWWRITTAGALSGFGRIGDETGALWLGYPSIAVNARDQVLIGYSIFSPEIFPSAGFSLRPSGCDGSLAQIHTLQEGLGPYVRLDASGLNRWGDLSEAVVDPADDLSMWTIQEYAAAPAAGASRWGTWWGGFSPAAASRDGICVSPVHRATPAKIP